MYCKVHQPINTPGVSDNKGKCTQLVEYLSKESQDVRPYYDNFFSQQKDFVTPRTVMHHIDNNHRTLKRNDDKFYMLSISNMFFFFIRIAFFIICSAKDRAYFLFPFVL